MEAFALERAVAPFHFPQMHYLQWQMAFSEASPCCHRNCGPVDRARAGWRPLVKGNLMPTVLPPMSAAQLIFLKRPERRAAGVQDVLLRCSPLLINCAVFWLPGWQRFSACLRGQWSGDEAASRCAKSAELQSDPSGRAAATSPPGFSSNRPSGFFPDCHLSIHPSIYWKTTSGLLLPSPPPPRGLPDAL